jgi:hypothetical protein
MSDPKKIKDIEEQITLAGLLPGVNLGYLPPEETAKLKRAVLNLYRLSHARGFDAGADHAMNATSSASLPQRGDSQTWRLKRWISARLREGWQDYKTSLRSIRSTVVRKFMEE